jgi:small subunit ribosomal protein S18
MSFATCSCARTNIDSHPGAEKEQNIMSDELDPIADMDDMTVTPFTGLDSAPLGDQEAVDESAEESVEESEDEGGDSYSGPEEYVERDKGERRRVGTDVRIDDVNFKNVPLLSRFLDRRGRIMSRRKTRVSAKMQRRIVREVKRARHLALLPYTADQTRQVRRRR